MANQMMAPLTKVEWYNAHAEHSCPAGSLTLVPLCHPRNQQPTVLDQDEYEYCMHGKVFQYKYEKNRKVSVLASFGGLLMLLQGEQRYFATVELDASIYCLIRRVADDRAAAETALQASKERRSKK